MPAPHQPELAHLLGKIVAVGRDHSSLAGRDVLGRVQGEARRICDRADRPAPVRRLDRVGGVLDDEPAPLAGKREDRVEIARLAGEVDRHDRSGALARDPRQQRGVEVEIRFPDVAEDGARAA